MDTNGQSRPTEPATSPYGGKLFEQYQLIVEETARISDRRHSTNNLFLSVNSVLLGAVALLIQQGTGKGDSVLLFLALLLVGSGAVLCVFWWRFLIAYDKRLRRRFGYLRDLETKYKDLLISVFSAHIVTESLSRMEARIPLVFLATYFIAVSGTVAYTLGLLAPLLALLSH